MIESKNATANTVKAVGQIDVNKFVTIFKRGGAKRVMFFGNSITRHEPNPDLGWYGDWGMAASSKEKDYVHLVVAELDKKYGKVDYCIAQGAMWEWGYRNSEEVLKEYYSEVKDFDPHIIIIRIGENVTAAKHLEVSCKPHFATAVDFLVGKSAEKVVITDMFWYSVYNDCLREVCEEKGYSFCHLTDLEEDERTMAKGLFDHQGVAGHPGDYGMQCIANRILEKIFE
jgi:hypothetical protein